MKTLLLLAVLGMDVETEIEALKTRVQRLEAAVYLPLPEASVMLPLPSDPAPPRRVVTSGRIVVPAGSHAHQTIDGRIIIHGNENMGNAAAHRGIERPWIRIAESGQTVRTTSASSVRYSSSDCPDINGDGRPDCPTQMSTRYQSTIQIGKPNRPFGAVGRLLSGKR